MNKASFQTDADVFTARKTFLKQFSDNVRSLVRDVHSETETEVLNALRQDPGPVKYPIQWTSERQRRAFFATNGFGGGIPTRRTNAINDGWRYETDGSKVEVFNVEPHAKWVVGSFDANNFAQPQQAMHRNTGWKLAYPIVTRVLGMTGRKNESPFRRAFVNRYRELLSALGKLTGGK